MSLSLPPLEAFMSSVRLFESAFLEGNVCLSRTSMNFSRISLNFNHILVTGNTQMRCSSSTELAQLMQLKTKRKSESISMSCPSVP